MKINVKVNAKNFFPQVQNATVNTLGSAMYMVAEEIMTDSKQNYVPVKTGALRRTGFVDKPAINGNRIVVMLGYNTPYARRVHEYPVSFGQGKNKYLSKPINAMVPQMSRRVVTHMKRLVGKP